MALVSSSICSAPSSNLNEGDYRIPRKDAIYVKLGKRRHRNFNGFTDRVFAATRRYICLKMKQEKV